MTEAIYIHATLYKFNKEARTQVITRFNNAINDISAKCWFVQELEAFELRTPGSIGAAADEKLST
ncbi:hypothetical protein LTR53_020498, partial [Teratosphaeriaceae sp. CCFEE 6253]